MIEKYHNLIANQDAIELRSTKLVWPPLSRKFDRIDAIGIEIAPETA